MALGLTARLVLTVGLFLVPAGAWIGFTVHNELDHVEEQVGQRLNAHQSEVLYGIENHLRTGQETLRVLSNLPELQGSAATCNAFLKDFGSSGLAFPAFARTDAQGRVDCASPVVELPVDLSGSGAFQRAMANRSFELGEIRLGQFANHPAVNMAYPLEDAEGDLIGTVMTATTIDGLLDLERAATLPEGSIVGMIDLNGVILASSTDPEKYVGIQLEADAMDAAMAAPGQVYPGTGPDGVKRLYTVSLVQLDERPIGIVVAGIPQEAATGPVITAALQDGAFILVLLLLVALAVAFAFRRVILKPVACMKGAADAMQAGALDSRISAEVTDRGDEIGSFARTLNQSADRLVEQIERLEHANQRISEIDRIKTNIINTVAHELRTPMLVVNLQLELLKKRLQGMDPDTVDDFIQITQRNTKRLDRLVQSLVKIASIQAGTLRIETQETPLPPLLERITEKWSRRAQDDGITLSVLPKDVHVHADPEALEDVLDELIDNALKFTPEEGTIMVEVHVDEDAAEIHIEDNGIGREDGSGPTANPLEPGEIPVRGGRIGIGAGLVIAQALTEKMNGTITYRRRPGGNGTEVVVRLDRVLRPALEAEETTPHRLLLQGTT